MSELYYRNGFCVSAGCFLNIDEENENEIILSFTDNTKEITRACFKKTNSPFSNYNKLQRIKSHLRKGDLLAVAGYRNDLTLFAHRFAIWSGAFCHDKLVDESGQPLTVIVGKIRGDRTGEPRNSILDPSGACQELLDFSIFVNDHSTQQIWNIQVSGKMARQCSWKTKAHCGAFVIGREVAPTGYAHRMLANAMMTVDPPLEASA